MIIFDVIIEGLSLGYAHEFIELKGLKKAKGSSPVFNKQMIGFATAAGFCFWGEIIT